MKLTWYGHSCFKLDCAEGSLVFDPYGPESVPGLHLPALTADAVICSHNHHDHNYAEGVTLSGRQPAFSLKTVASFHDDVGGKKRGANTITVLESEGIRAVHMGDIGSALSAEQIAAIGAVDVLMVPVGGYYTVSALEAWDIARSLQAKLIIPMHYRTANAGYKEIAPLEAFVAFGREVKFLSGNTYEVDMNDVPSVVVFRL